MGKKADKSLFLMDLGKKTGLGARKGEK